MILTEIDHIAIAVRDLDAAIDYYAKAFGAEVHHREIVESDGVEEALVKVADSYIQLTAATRPDSPIAEVDREARRGPASRRLSGRRLRGHAGPMIAAGATPIDQAPRPGGRGYHRGVRAPEGQLRHLDRARTGVTQLDADGASTGLLPAAVLWDMDGTLVDTEPYWFAADRDLVEEFGHQWPDHHAEAVVGFDLLDSASTPRTRSGPPAARGDRRPAARRRHRPAPPTHPLATGRSRTAR